MSQIEEAMNSTVVPTRGKKFNCYFMKLFISIGW
jgi:hypothetical protein